MLKYHVWRTILKNVVKCLWAIKPVKLYMWGWSVKWRVEVKYIIKAKLIYNIYKLNKKQDRKSEKSSDKQ